MPPMTPAKTLAAGSWPRLAYADWADTCATLHLWTQVVGKVRLALAPDVNHWWQVALYVTARGLTTSAMPYRGRSLQIDFDFIDHRLIVRTSDGQQEQVALTPRSVADFYAEVMGRLRSLGIDVHIWTMPVEIPDAIPFDADHVHASYDAAAVHTFWRQLVQVERVFNLFRARFIGKCSPVHFFWGSFDLAVTRFSGRAAPLSIPMPIRSPRVSRKGRCGRRARLTTPHSVNSCCLMMPWPTRRRRMRRCSISCRAPTRPAPIARDGTGRRWSGKTLDIIMQQKEHI